VVASRAGARIAGVVVGSRHADPAPINGARQAWDTIAGAAAPHAGGTAGEMARRHGAVVPCRPLLTGFLDDDMISKLLTALSRLFGPTDRRTIALPPSASAREGSGSDPVAPVRDAIDEMIPDYSVASYVGDAGAEQFKVVGRVMLDWFKTYCDLKPEESVLEVGCGIGRIAIPLTQYLTRGRYVGFDIVPHGIEWCRKTVTPRYPNFTFFLADVYNRYYHPEGRQAAADYAFPFDDASFDFVFLTSVFTHMMPRDVEHYTAEIGRVLKPGGRCFCTVYIICDEARRELAGGNSLRAFAPYPEGYWSDTPDNPEAAVAYPLEFFSSALSRAGLETSRILSGEWWKTQFAQDILIARKPPLDA